MTSVRYGILRSLLLLALCLVGCTADTPEAATTVAPAATLPVTPEQEATATTPAEQPTAEARTSTTEPAPPPPRGSLTHSRYCGRHRSIHRCHHPSRTGDTGI